MTSRFGRMSRWCHCWLLTRQDGVRLGFTDHDQTVLFDGLAFLPHTGLLPSEARTTLGLAADSQDVEGALSSDAISADDVRDGLYGEAKVETWRVDWSDPENRELLRTAEIGSISLEDGRFVAELSAISAKLDHVTGRLFRRACDAELGDVRCRVDLSVSSRRTPGTIVKVSGRSILHLEVDVHEPDGWYDHGILEPSGEGEVSRRLRIASSRRAGNELRIVLAEHPHRALDVGQVVTLTTGCDKGFATCRTKFANRLNFRGFPHLPGNDSAYGYVSADQPLDGGALVR